MLIIIDGPINSGKSTVSRGLANLMGGCIVIEGDALRHFADCLTIDESIPFTLEDAGDLAAKWLERSFTVIFNYPIAPYELHHFMNRIPEGVPTHTFSLHPSVEVCSQQRGRRVLDSREVARIQEMYASRLETGVIGDLIDNSTMSASECAGFLFQTITEQGAG